MNKKKFRKRALMVAAATVTTTAALTLGTGRIANADTFSLGDVNFDGKVDLLDAQMVLKGALHISDLNDVQFEAADVNLDGKVDLKDAQNILRGALHIEKIEGEISHEHNWKEYTAARQVWVPNIVTVDDYKDEIVEKGCLVCTCGAEFDSTKEGLDALDEHAQTNLLKEAYEGIPCECGGFMIYEPGSIRKVKVGSHEEDHGHYEEETYVDHYYCDCGATK